MKRISKMLQLAISLALIPAAAAICFAQENPDLQAYFKDYIGLSDDQIASIRGGHLAIGEFSDPTALRPEGLHFRQRRYQSAEKLQTG
jgi:hypothetical protein